MARPSWTKTDTPGIFVDDQKRHWISTKINGKTVERLIGTKTAAKAYLNKRKEEGRLARLFPEEAQSRAAKRRGGVTVAELCAKYRTEDELHNRNHAKHAALEQEWIELLGDDFHAADLSVELMVAQQAKWRTEGAAPATVNRKVARLRAVLELAVRDKLLRFNPIYGLRRLEEPNGRDRILTAGEEDRLHAELPEWAWRYVEFALLSGFRQEEQFAVELDQVHLEQNGLRLPETKSGYPRTIPMSDDLRALVLELLEIAHEKGSNWLFPNRRGSNHDRPNNFLRRWFVPALERAGIEGLWWHDLRRTCGTRLHQSGNPVATIQAYLGHTSSATTDRYLAQAPEHLSRMVRSQKSRTRSGA